MVDRLRLLIPAGHAGRRLDLSLAQLLPAHSRSRIQRWIEAGGVVLDGRPASRRDRVLGGETAELAMPEAAGEPVDRPEAIALDIVFEDEAVIVINKPPGLVVHPGAGNRQGTLLNALLHHAPELAALPRAGIVHRLDKDTSGLLVVARTAESQTALVRALQARAVKRVYWAVAHGRPSPPEGEIDAPIGRHPVQRTRMAVVSSGRPAQTAYRVLRQFATAAWLECRLRTGRTHQIRVHLAHLGHPLVGDPVYAGRRRAGRPAFGRQALHALRLGFTHPLSGREVDWEAPPPADLQALLAELDAGLGSEHAS